jgi:hypothetical protein
MRDHPLALLVVLCLCSLFSSILTASIPLTSSADCPYQQVPTNLNTETYLQLKEEFHFQQTFFHDYAVTRRDISFSLLQETAVRVYVAPHELDIDIYLLNSLGRAIAVCE